MSDAPVCPEYTFVEAILGIAGIRQYVQIRREKGLGEDAVLAYFYDKLLKSTREAAELDPDGYAEAADIAAIPQTLYEEIKGGDYL